MKVISLHDIAPVTVCANDVLSVIYAQDVYDEGGTLLDHDEATLIEAQPFTKMTKIDRVAVVELESGELASLGLRQGVAAVLGEKL
jgi:hypothetical protein